MGKIKTSISVEDKVSPAFESMNTVANSTINTFSALNSTIDNTAASTEYWTAAVGNYDKSALEAVYTTEELVEMGFKTADALGSTEEALENVENKLDDVENEENDVHDENEELSLSMTEVNQGLEILNKAWSALISVMQEANKWIELNNNQFNQEFLAAVKLKTVLGADEGQIQSLYDYASALQQIGVVGDEATLSGVQTLSMYTDNYDQVVKLIPLVDDLAVSMNGLETSQSNVESAAQMVGKALTGTTTTLTRQGIITTEQAEKLQGMNTVAERAAYLQEVLEDRIGGTNEALANTAQGGIMQADNALGDLGETLGASVTPYVTELKSAITDALAPAIQWIADNMSWIAPIFLTLVAVIGLVIAVLTVYAVCCAIAALSELALFWPLLLIVAAILLIIGLVVLVVSIINNVTGSSISAIGVITGALSVAGAFIWNLFAAVVNFVIDAFAILWNFIAAFVNFFANVFTDPVGAIARLFFDLVDCILALLQALASAIDSIFGSNLAGSVQGWRDSLSGWVDETFGEGEEIMATINGEDYHLERSAYGDAWDSGYSFGENMQNAGNSSLDLNNLLSGLSDSELGSDIADTASNTGSIADSMDITEDELKYLRDLAEQEVVNRYTTAEINIEMNNNNNINEKQDVDGIVSELEDKIYEMSLSMAEGVHN